MTDQCGPGSHVLYQDFVVPTVVTNRIAVFEKFVEFPGAFSTPDTLDFNVSPNQQGARSTS